MLRVSSNLRGHERGLGVSRVWPPGAVTGLGSLPGTDPAEAARVVFGELPDLPHFVELPERGAGADFIGRSASLLADLPVEIVASGWRLTARAGRDLRRARDYLSRDLDALEVQADGYAGALKVQFAGPWTLAAGLELPSGHTVVSDHGASRDLAQSLAEGVRRHLADLASRVPSARLVVQLDEPTLPDVLGARLPTPSGYGTVRAVDASIVRAALRDVLLVAPVGARAVHCCAPDVPIGLLREAGADALGFDLNVLTNAHLDALGEAVEAGTSLWLGVLSPTAPETDNDARTGTDPSFDAARAAIRRLWSQLGFPDDELAGAVVPTPECGLANAAPERARAILALLRDLGRDLVDPLERSAERDA